MGRAENRELELPHGRYRGLRRIFGVSCPALRGLARRTALPRAKTLSYRCGITLVRGLQKDCRSGIDLTGPIETSDARDHSPLQGSTMEASDRRTSLGGR